MIVEIIKAERLKKGWSQQKLADEAGVTRWLITRMEGGHHSPTAKTLEKLIKAFGSIKL